MFSIRLPRLMDRIFKVVEKKHPVDACARSEGGWGSSAAGIHICVALPCTSRTGLCPRHTSLKASHCRLRLGMTTLSDLEASAMYCHPATRAHFRPFKARIEKEKRDTSRRGEHIGG